jgi:hypothetical protein
MRLVFLNVILAAALTLCLSTTSGCTKHAEHILPTATTRPRITDSSAQPIQPHNDCANANRPLDLIRIMLFNVGEQYLDSSYTLHYTSDAGGNYRVVGSTPVPPPPIHMMPFHTYVDVDAKQYLTKAHDVVLIEVDIVDQPGVYFATGNNSVVSDANSRSDTFCVKHPMNTPANSTTIYFYARDVKPQNYGDDPVVGSYTLNFTGADGRLVSLAVDPSVKNDG